MKIDILTLFPESFEPIKQSIIGRAVENKRIDIILIKTRLFTAVFFYARRFYENP